MNKDTHISLNNFADICGVSRLTVDKWIAKRKCVPHTDNDGRKYLIASELSSFPEIDAMLNTSWEEESQVVPKRMLTSIELFAGAGGLALGMHLAGFKHVLLNEFDKAACETLTQNMPDWNVVQGDIHDIDFTPYRNKVDFLSGGFPCQAFSYAGKRLGFEETRGTLFFELARAVKEIRPKVFMAENVKGLLEHDNGRTIDTIKSVIAELGYTLIQPRVLRALLYNVPQKRERLILIAIRNDIAPYVRFEWPSVCGELRTLRDAFYAGNLYNCDVPESEGQKYPIDKQLVMKLVPEGGDWRDLPEDIARQYMKGSYNLGGGKTGMARRLSMDEASLTLTCAPAQKQTERCHPIETRPLTVREYARIQTFPDSWKFCGSMSAKYKQIGNAVPVNLSWAIGRSLIRLFNQIESVFPQKELTESFGVYPPVKKLHGLFEGMACDPSEQYE
ncbi:MAG: DNA (cytosine-5-)-methyltransferase [Bacteroides sp.]|nr:DNA (cytosine-5-)-methyltransferase [Bacteroides sp.]MCM1413578.1 DNA (cytosine-5-)-methyltransferase [Bacteroides sp.]MCM1471205.1 DNA (cytosine-5-)-methyltransferase [Bacteroides sp.]